MAVWLKARGAQKNLRDGTSRGNPMRTVGDAPVLFAQLSAEAFEHSSDFIVEPPNAPGSNIVVVPEEAADEIERLVGRVSELELVVQLSRGAEEEARQKAAIAQARADAVSAELAAALEQLGAQAAQLEQLTAAASGGESEGEEPKARRASGRKG